MAKVKDVAAFFIDVAQKQNEKGLGDLMTNLRLQKLLYFAQGWHLARYGRLLFEEPIEAWQYGPLVPTVYHQYSPFGGQGIVITDAPDDTVFTPEEYDLLLDVIREYDALSTYALVRITHEQGSPWSKTQQKAEISQTEMQRFFSAQPPLMSFDDLLDEYPVEVL